MNYRAANYICNCIQSAIAFDSSRQFEWIVVDNHSGDNSQEVVLSRFPFVRWIDIGYNAGFARANNAGISAARGTVVLLLNPDTVVQNDAVGKCFHDFVNSAYVACGVQLLNEDGTPQISGNYFMRGGLNYLLPLPYLGKLVKRAGILAGVQKPNIPEARAETEVDWINGAFLMVKRTAIEKAGLMDEDFFLYAEEAEWCYRLHKTGKLCIFGQYKVVHLQGETANEAFGSAGKGYYNLFDRKGLQIMLSTHVRIRKQFGTGWYLFHLVCYTISVPVFFIGSFLENLFRRGNPFFDFQRAFRFAGNVIKLWGYAVPIVRNKPRFYKVL